MALHWDRNGRKYLIWMFSGARLTRLGSFLCLAALLAQLYIPLVHQCEHILEGFVLPAAFAVGQKTEPSIGAAEPQNPHHSHHDAATCPICQAALICRYFAAPTISLAPILGLPIQRCCDTADTSIAANPDILISRPRSPPTLL